ncbi:F0F1 ATP synthase subunit epsilon [Siculibacillus lacustris]|uniref:ATP synthase epsilon chain n=1 Tax=Siculibacillus lacustris TaxID=1549641 RepID=A0A4V2KU46_9HYPH|nr:F0F1 ATP synthase subunit epsilon [Siculibacillus lacustris]TBW39994.1 F0F1 ATP synthase subunit epsilon [Siculibacillus lacustris]
MAEGFKFELVSPARLVLSEEATQVVVPGSEGDFTMLKGHSPFMTTVRPGVVEVTVSGGRIARIFVRGGFADASPAGLTILAEQAIPVEELKADVIAREIQDAEEDVADASTDEVKRVAQEKLDQLRAVFAATTPAGH